jgi:UDP:flavonoid glycosyltransferase YjiC (YdhE family)
MPEMIDQFYWGNRVFKMELGPKPVSSKKVTVNELSTVLEQISNGKYRNKTENFSEEIRKEDGISKIVDLIIGLRVTEEEEVRGLDISLHKETGYSF